jgi:hypothetical protein
MPSAARQLTLPWSEAVASPAAVPVAPAAQAPERVPARSRRAERGDLLERAARLADRLSTMLNEHVHLAVTDNTSTMVSFRRSRQVVAFRVHHMFLEAPPEVVRALADYAAGARPRAGAVIDGFVRSNEERVRAARAERQGRGLVAGGTCHDLSALYAELNATFFGGAIEARIGWGREPPARRRRSIKMGTYFHDARVIRVHPALDRPEVPDFFVRFIVFHEMLHQAVPPVTRGGRRLAHPPEFRERERSYPGYARALAWERRHLALLLGRKPRLRPFDPEDPLAP